MRTRGTFLCVVACALFACGGDDDSQIDPTFNWSTVNEEMSSAMLAVAGSSDDDVWMVGGRPDGSDDPLVFHYSNAEWQAVDLGVTGADLWWTFALEDGTAFFGGSGGTLVRRTTDGTVDVFDSPGTGIVFGMWGASADDVWAVGGRAGGGSGFAWRFDGEAWTDVALDQDIVDTSTLFKVAGRSADDVWMVGGRGVVLHWNGSSLVREDVMLDGEAVDATLFSVGVDSERVIAAGGTGLNGIIVENDGSGWIDASPSRDLLRWRGIAVTDGAAYVVGEQAQVMSRGDDGTWRAEVTNTTIEDLHAAWISPDGAVWAVGGKFEDTPMRDGVIIYGGAEAPEVMP